MSQPPDALSPSALCRQLSNFSPWVTTCSLSDNRGLPVASPVQPTEANSTDLKTLFQGDIRHPVDTYGFFPKPLRELLLDMDLHKLGGDKIAQAVNHFGFASLPFLQGDDPEKALEHVRVAESLAASSGKSEVGLDVLRLKAAALTSFGRLEEAITTYQEVIRRSGRLDNKTDQAETFASIGWAYQSLDRPVEAIDAYTKAFELYHTLNNRDGETQTLIGLASLYQAIGDFPKAFEHYLKAAPIASNEQYARILVNFAAILQSKGLQDRAISAYEEASTRIRETDDRALMADIAAGLGRSHMILGEFKDARSDFDRALSLLKDLGDRTGQAGILASIARLNFRAALWSGMRDISREDVKYALGETRETWELDIGGKLKFQGLPSGGKKKDYKEAVDAYNMALTLMHEAGSYSGEIGVLTEMGELYEIEGELQHAIDSYRQALALLENMRNSVRLEEFRVDLSDQSEALYTRLVELEIRTRNFETAFDFSEGARARALLDMLGNTRINVRSDVPDALSFPEETLRRENVLIERQLRQEYSKPMPQVDPQRVRSLQIKLSTVRNQYQQSLEEVKMRNPDYASFLSISPLNLHQVQQQLGPDTTLLSYFTLDEMTLAFVVTSDNFHCFKIPIQEHNLGLAISTLLDFAGNSETTQVSHLLYNALIAPLKSHLKTSVLLISPYGILHNLPFGALSSDGTTYLADAYSITLLPSISAWPYLRSKGKRGLTNALVMANDDVEGLPHLGSGHREAEAVASLFGSTALFGKAASVSTLREHGGEYSIVHLVAHIDHDAQHPRSSHVVLDQDLDIDEVLGLNLQKTDLVVLSGCQSDKGERTRGDDVIALSRAFMYAGAPSVVASLWSVDDESTGQLMVAFYSHLRDGLSKAEALQAAQKDIRRSFPNPYYWASFVLMGDPGTPAKSPVAVSTP